MIRDYKETSIGIIPEDWGVVRLGNKNVANLIMGQSPPSSTYNQEEIGFPFLQGKAEFGEIYPSPEVYCSEPIRIAEKNDVLLSVRAPVGDVNITPFKCCIGRGLTAIRTREDELNHRFLFYYLKFADRRFEALSMGSTFKAIRKGEIERFQIPLPPIEEQQRVADFLSTVDNAIKRADEAVAKTERLKKGLMQKLLAEGIGHKEFKETKIGKIPKTWKVVRLRSIVDDKSDIVAGPFGSNLKVCDYKPNGVPIIRLQNIERNQFINKDIRYISPEKAEELKYHSYELGDIVLAKLGDPIGKTCIVPSSIEAGVVVADVVRIRPSPKKAIALFVEYVLNSSMCSYQLRRQTIGSTRPRVNISQVRNLRIPLPTQDEQQQIADILSTLDYKLELDTKRKGKLERIKKGLMNDLLTGRRRVKVAM